MDELPLEVLTDVCCWATSKELCGIILTNRKIMAASHGLIHEENERSIKNIKFLPDYNGNSRQIAVRCKTYSGGEWKFVPIPSVDVPANIKFVKEINIL